MANCAFSAPHREVTDIGMHLLRSGASAIDAMVAAAAAIAVAYPHMNGLGGDGFWLISAPGKPPLAIDGAGVAMSCAPTLNQENQALSSGLPSRGPQACLTLPGAVASWALARQHALTYPYYRPIPLTELFAPAMHLAKAGLAPSQSLLSACRKLEQQVKLSDPAFAELAKCYIQPLLSENQSWATNPKLADTLQQLAVAGLSDFYRGDIAGALISSLNGVGVALRAEEMSQYAAQYRQPINVALRHGRVYNLPAPTQGFASLMILGLFDRLYRPGMSQASQMHGLIEATKKAFILRDTHLADPQFTQGKESTFVSDAFLDKLAAEITPQASPWPQAGQVGDTIWMGCVDKQGVMVSFIQSLYWEFGAGVMCPTTGVVWNNRGCSFSVLPKHPNAIAPGKRPMHTLNPAYAEFTNGRRMVYGTMGGDGQPQTQAAIYTRYAYNKLSLQHAISNDRWLLGRTWGDTSSDLKIEQQLAQQVSSELSARGHIVRSVASRNEMMGHAGAVCMGANGEIECASDPRSDGKADTSAVN